MATNYVDEGFFKAVWQHETWYNNHIESGVNANCKKKKDIQKLDSIGSFSTLFDKNTDFGMLDCHLCGRMFLKKIQSQNAN